jgi:hypothetical protein
MSAQDRVHGYLRQLDTEVRSAFPAIRRGALLPVS